MTLGIIGTAGRKDDGSKLTREVFKAMGLVGKEVLDKTKATALVSGGAAYADHVAVRLFLRGYVKKLTLHLPCKWDKKQICLKDTGEFNYQTNPGGTANYYHRKFSQVVGINSLEDISKAIEMGAKVVVTEGFKERNTKVAEESDIILAMTFGNGAYIKDGGTADTVRKFFAKEGVTGFHYDLNTLTLYDDIILN
jgi:hypothetical protein